MINASGGFTPNANNSQNNDSGASTITPNASTGPGFPTHNPAMQHKQFMSTTSIENSTEIKKPEDSLPVKNSAGAVPPAPPKFPDPTKNLIKVTGDKSETDNGGSDNKNDSTKPKRKFNLKMIVGVAVLLLVIIGSGAGFYLSQQQQDVRQQASETIQCPDGEQWYSCVELCLPAGTSNIDAGCKEDGTGTRDKKCSETCTSSYQCKIGLSCFRGVCWGDSCEDKTQTTTDDLGGGQPQPSSGIDQASNTPVIRAACTSGQVYSTDGSNLSYTIDFSTLGNINQFTSAGLKYRITFAGDKFSAAGGTSAMYEDLNNKFGISWKSGELINGVPVWSTMVLGSPTPNTSFKFDKTTNIGTGNKKITDLITWIKANNLKITDQESVFKVKVDYGSSGQQTNAVSVKLTPDACAEKLLEVKTSCTAGQTYSADGSSLSHTIEFVNPSQVTQYASAGFNYRLMFTADDWIKAGGNSAMYNDLNNQFGISWKSGELINGVPVWSVMPIGGSVTSTSFTLDNSKVIGSGNKKLTDLITWIEKNNLTITKEAPLFQAKVDYSGKQTLGAYLTTIAKDGCVIAPPTINTSAPSAPTNLIATAGDTKAVLKWDKPTNNGGVALKDYKIEYKKSTDAEWSAFADEIQKTRSAIVTGLTNDVEYQFRVFAINTADLTSVSSNVASSTPTTPALDPTAPAAPTNLNAAAGNGQVALEWTAPTDTGNMAITDYKVKMKKSSDSTFVTISDSVSADTVATVTNLTNNVSYDFAVLAVNDFAEGPLSVAVSSTPQSSNSNDGQDDSNTGSSDEDSTTDDNSSSSDDTSTTVIGCNATCVTTSDCTSTNHTCTTTEDGSKKCRLTSNPTSTSCTLLSGSAASTTQPTTTGELPATGPEDWLNWLKAGLVTLGLGATLFFLL